MILQGFDLIYFGKDRKNFFGKDGFQNVFFFYQVTLVNVNTLVLKEVKGTEYFISWKSKELFKTELYLLHNAFLTNVKRFGYKIEIQFNNTHLVIDKSFYTSKTVKAYIVYHLDYWPISLLNNFILKNCLFGAANTAKIVIKICLQQLWNSTSRSRFTEFWQCYC